MNRLPEAIAAEEYKAHLLQMRAGLRSRAVQTAVLRSDIPDYVRMPWINNWKDKEIDLKAEAQAAEIAAFRFRDTQFTHIVGIGDSGLSSARAVHQRFPKTELRFVHKVKQDKDDEDETGLMIKAYSYSKRQNMFFSAPFLPQNSRLLIADDVLAYGKVGSELINCYRQNGCEVVGMAVYFDKVFQVGLEKIEKELGVPAFSVIRIAGIDGEGDGRRIRTLDNDDDFY